MAVQQFPGTFSVQIGVRRFHPCSYLDRGIIAKSPNDLFHYWNGRIIAVELVARIPVFPRPLNGEDFSPRSSSGSLGLYRP